MDTWGFAKGHGTHNDFVLLKDRTGSVPLTAEQVRFLCDRHGGIGADGVIRAIKAAHVPEWDGDADLWFMDYRNADGSLAEMCGNGLRVFGRFLMEEGLADSNDLVIATRAGLRGVRELPDGRLCAQLGAVRVGAQPTWVSLDGVRHEATVVDVGNPHAVVLLDDDVDLAQLDLTRAPQLDPDVFPSGANVEFVHANDEHDLSMRVHERGSGETLSCGTGVAATAAAQASAHGALAGRFTVTVPGGRLEVVLDGDRAELIGPAVIIARGEVLVPDRADHLVTAGPRTRPERS
ncbi:diaminopimelate epimerase [Propionibacterium australiense]|uniref:Diaminopimelate epimerase n=1 Tax=Propionibacterium australiense TaxID=119981 RepID=A0A383S492_9ACTN|nr:diaminopimelate epimerase [Propionibacterium australiense]RLP10635.1 diaminopimelate epimerase [Propionibacterium australiense]RLP12930.1 diaminopimelate epimerase [Propionibacterium australiense]SYZ32838.1 diaminopimelate epimerase [Propionibacterium australiense]VEH91143.1 Diaminopimelate epimerase [Propionibacterium australiense]